MTKRQIENKLRQLGYPIIKTNSDIHIYFDIYEFDFDLSLYSLWFKVHVGKDNGYKHLETQISQFDFVVLQQLIEKYKSLSEYTKK